MQTKPYSLQSPEQIAKDYAGNKQKIAQAMQMGIVDPTAGVLAGMFIDRMRSAQAQEMAPKPSVAQQVMNPRQLAPTSQLDADLQAAFGYLNPPLRGGEAPPAGLGATPQAAAPMAPPGGAGMAPQPQAAPPPGMAAGGMFDPPYMAGGGLSEIPLPDTMFDENRDGGYANGGIVAFAQAGSVNDPNAQEELPEIVSTAKIPPADPTAGLGKTYAEQMALINKFAPQKSKYGTRLLEALEAEMSPEAQKKRKKEDFWSTVTEFGFGIAGSKEPTLFGAIGESGMKAAPKMAERAKERRAEQREAIKALAGREDVSNKQATEAFALAAELQKAYAGLLDAKAARELQERLAKTEGGIRLMAARIAAGPGYAAAYAPTGTERILDLARRDTKVKDLIKELGIFGGSSTTGGTGGKWGPAEVVGT